MKRPRKYQSRFRRDLDVPTADPPSPDGTPSWWPPSVGDKLRGIWGPESDRTDPLLHVVAVFQHDDRAHVVTAEWQVARWIYETHAASKAIVGLIRPDGMPRIQR